MEERQENAYAQMGRYIFRVKKGRGWRRSIEPQDDGLIGGETQPSLVNSIQTDRLTCFVLLLASDILRNLHTPALLQILSETRFASIVNKPFL